MNFKAIINIFIHKPLISGSKIFEQSNITISKLPILILGSVTVSEAWNTWTSPDAGFSPGDALQAFTADEASSCYTHCGTQYRGRS